MSRQFPWVVIKFLRRHRRPSTHRRLVLHPADTLDCAHGITICNAGAEDVFIVSERARYSKAGTLRT